MWCEGEFRISNYFISFKKLYPVKTLPFNLQSVHIIFYCSRNKQSEISLGKLLYCGRKCSGASQRLWCNKRQFRWIGLEESKEGWKRTRSKIRPTWYWETWVDLMKRHWDCYHNSIEPCVSFWSLRQLGLSKVVRPHRNVETLAYEATISRNFTDTELYDIFDFQSKISNVNTLRSLTVLTIRT